MRCQNSSIMNFQSAKNHKSKTEVRTLPDSFQFVKSRDRYNKLAVIQIK